MLRYIHLKATEIISKTSSEPFCNTLQNGQNNSIKNPQIKKQKKCQKPTTHKSAPHG